jgi:hypothetical protein
VHYVYNIAVWLRNSMKNLHFAQKEAIEIFFDDKLAII